MIQTMQIYDVVSKNVPDNELGLTEDDFKTLRMIRENNLPVSRSDLPENTRRVLHVEDRNYYLILSNSKTSGDSEEKKSGSAVILRGSPSNGSSEDLNRAFITLVNDDDQVKAPQYIKERASIFLWVHQRNLETLLAQIREPKVYCWIRHDEGGHIYGDIHTGPKI